MRKSTKLVIGAMLLVAILVESCTKTIEPTSPQFKTTKDFDATVINKWLDVYILADGNITGYRPPVAARVLAYTGLAGYEAAAPGMLDYQSIASNFPELKLPKAETGKEYHWAESVNAAYWSTMKNFFPITGQKNVARFDSLGVALTEQYRKECDTATFSRSKKFGEAVAKVINDWAFVDGGEDGYRNNKPASYVPPVGEGLWRFTGPDFRHALLPYWGKVRSMSLKPEDKIALPPIKYSTDKGSDFYKQALDTYTKSKNIMAEQRWIAEFWSDDEPLNTFDPAMKAFYY